MDKCGYSVKFGNNRASIIYESKVVGNCNLIDGLHRLSLTPIGEDLSFNVDKSVANRSLIREKSRLLWHKRLSHISKDRMDRLVKAKILPSLNMMIWRHV